MQNQTAGMGGLGPNDPVPDYQYVAWPAWRYDPETGKGEIFESEDQVPDGWTNVPPGTTPAGEEPIQLDPAALVLSTEGAGGTDLTGSDGTGEGTNDGAGDKQEDAPVYLTHAELVDLGQDKLGEILTEKNKADGVDIEFMPNWPKVKLAQVVIDNGGYTGPKKEA